MRMYQNFKQSLAFVLQSEGGNDDDPQDHGGRTSRGITQREYDAWREEKRLLHQDVWKASQDEISSIYYEEYWLPTCDSLPTGMDYLFFDMAVNAGPVAATKILQRSLGVIADGRIGPVTRQAITRMDARQLIETYTDYKKNFYLSLHQPRFIKGWLNRANFVEKNALDMVKGGEA